MARILTSFYSKRLILNITLFGKAIFLERVTKQKSLEVNNEDNSFEKGYQVDLGCSVVDICKRNQNSQQSQHRALLWSVKSHVGLLDTYTAKTGSVDPIGKT